MLKVLCLLIPFVLGQVEFSTRPNNVSILLLYFTQEEAKEATVVSPFGLWSLMAGLSFGATGGTRREIFRSFLLLTDQTKFYTQYKILADTVFPAPTANVNVTNRNFYFIDSNFYPLISRDFKDFLVQNYDTSVKYFDFANPRAAALTAISHVQSISQPVSSIFVPEDFQESSLIMGNVLFFKGIWSLPFNSSYTNIVESNNRQVTMMFQKARIPYSYMESMQASIMELSYGNDGKYSMLLITPDPNISVQIVYKNFERVTLRDVLNKLQKDVNDFGLNEVDVKLPRLKKKSYLNLQKTLNTMGIYDAFDPTYARFPKVARVPIYIGSIEHNVFLAITESGTLAFGTVSGRVSFVKTLQDENIPSNLILFIIEKTTASIIFGGIFP